jgi:hypothetical protein
MVIFIRLEAHEHGAQQDGGEQPEAVCARWPARSAWWEMVSVTPEVSSSAVLMSGSERPHGLEFFHRAGRAVLPQCGAKSAR